jgi:HK97 family phage major capsid protein
VPSATDELLTGYVTEIEERQAFIDGVVKSAQEHGGDLDSDKMEMITRARDRISHLNEQMQPLEESRRIASDSKHRIEALAQFMDGRERHRPENVQYRSAGAYAIDMWRAGLGNSDARERLEMFNRAAAHQTTGDNPGLLPEQILGPVINFVDETRPLTNALGPRQLPSGSWSRPQVTQHTNVAAQAGEKTELVSRKMVINKIPVTATTYGGYVNVSRQDIDWTQPSAMDIIIDDLAGYYAQVTEAALGTAVVAAATAGADLPATPSGGDVAGALWAAAAAVFTATKGQGRLIVAAPPSMLALVGPLFAPVNPSDAHSSGFSAGQFGTGVMGAISAIQVVVSGGMAADEMCVLSTAAVEVYEDRIGALQVVEPSVLGVQVAYAGYYAPLVIEGDGIIKIVK